VDLASLLASGIIQGLLAFIAVQGKENLLHLAAGAVEGILGLLLLAYSPDTAVSLIPPPPWLAASLPILTTVDQTLVLTDVTEVIRKGRAEH